MIKKLASGAFLTLLICASVSAGVSDGDDYTISVGTASGVNGDTVTVAVTLDSDGPNALALQGWSFGVCHTDAAIEVVAASPRDGATTMTINGGAAPGFFSYSDFPNVDLPNAGWTQGIVIDLFGVNTLPVGAGYEIALADYTLGGSSGTYALDVCDTLGTPPVAAVVVEGGSSLTPNFVSGSISILSPNFVTAADATGVLSVGSVDSDIQLTNVDPVAAVQVALTYDDSLITPSSAAPVGPAAGAGFFEVQPGAPSGELAVGLIMDFGSPPPGTTPIPAGTDVAIITVTWGIDPMAPTPSNAPLTFTDGIGSPAVNNIIAFGDGGTETPNLIDGRINLVNFNPFLRGDCNFDGQVDIADGVYNLNFNFQGGPAPMCSDACDFNDDSTIDSTDAIQTFNYVLGLPVGMEPPPPPAPGPFTPGTDPTSGDGLGCNGDADGV